MITSALYAFQLVVNANIRRPVASKRQKTIGFFSTVLDSCQCAPKCNLESNMSASEPSKPERQTPSTTMHTLSPLRPNSARARWIIGLGLICYLFLYAGVATCESLTTNTNKNNPSSLGAWNICGKLHKYDSQLGPCGLTNLP